MAVSLPYNANAGDYFVALLNAGIDYTEAKNPAPVYNTAAAAQQEQRDTASVRQQPQADPSSNDGVKPGTVMPFLSTPTGKAVAIGGGLIAGLAVLKAVKVI